jgi:hypothetical protein
MNDIKLEQSKHISKLKSLVQKANALRQHKDRPVDVSLADMVQEELGINIDDFYDDLGVDLSFDTVQNFFTTPSPDVRWLIPEIFRDALRLGYRNAPIWPAITAKEEQVNGLSQILPYINMSDAAPKKLGEGETIPVGTLSYGERSFRIWKFGRGIKLTDEVRRYVSLAVVSIYLQDFGLKMGQGVDTLAINTVLNGEQKDGSNASPIIGVTDSSKDMVFRDLMRVWVRLSKMGRNPKIMIAGENTAMDIMDLPQFYNREQGTTRYNLNVKTPLPQGADLYINGNINANHIVIIDPSVCLLKMNAVPLMVESERIVSNQTSAFYASFTTGFAKLFDDSAIIINKAIDFEDSGNGFPDYFDVDPTTWVLME